MTTNDKLLGCPFCGVSVEHKTERNPQYPFNLCTWIKCTQCRQAQICSDWYNGDLGCMEAAWNRRVDHPNKQSLPKTLEQERDEHVHWTRCHYGEESAKKIKAIYNEGIAAQSTQNTATGCPKCSRVGYHDDDCLNY